MSPAAGKHCASHTPPSTPNTYAAGPAPTAAARLAPALHAPLFPFLPPSSWPAPALTLLGVVAPAVVGREQDLEGGGNAQQLQGSETEGEEAEGGSAGLRQCVPRSSTAAACIWL